MTTTYKTGETPAVGDVVRVGSGKITWRVMSLWPSSSMMRAKASLKRVLEPGEPWSRVGSNFVEYERLVLITPASDAERAAAERRMAEVEAEGVRLRELAQARRRVEQFVEQYIDTPSYGDEILNLGRTVDGQATHFALTISDLRALLAEGSR